MSFFSNFNSSKRLAQPLRLSAIQRNANYMISMERRDLKVEEAERASHLRIFSPCFSEEEAEEEEPDPRKGKILSTA